MEMRWIPVEEAMPTENEKVLIATYNQHWDRYCTTVAAFTGRDDCWAVEHGSYVGHMFSSSDALNRYNVRVLAWMEMPKYENGI